MSQTMTENVSTPTQTKADDPMAKLTQLKKMVEAELITEQEYSAKKQDILSQM
jgi:hypothetical protein